ncbi:MAG: hypothetical protein J0M15_04490 [Deltaproteobacteria bacterium]|jgi:hypothetical protein|nr:hypothetical protein [Deltaproteobacteria bacterium]
MKSHPHNSLIAFLFIFTLVLVYQNCAPRFQTEDLSSINSTNQNTANTFMIDSSYLGADFSWSTLNQNSKMNRNNYDRIERWYDATGKFIPLYPAFVAGTKTLDMDHSALWKSTEKGPRLSFEARTSLTSIAQDSSAFLSKEYSILLFVGNLKIPTTTENATDPKRIRLFTLSPVNSEEAGLFVVDVFKDANKKANFQATYWFNGTTYSTSIFSLPGENLAQGFAIAVRYPTNGRELMLAINGELGSEKTSVVGTLPNMGFVNRNLELHSSYYANQGSFEFAEIGVFKKSLSDEELKSHSLGLFRTHELQLPTSIADDDSSGDRDSNENPKEVTFSSIKSIFQKSINGSTCIGCHSAFLSSRDSLLAATTQGKGNWVVPDNSAGSLLIKSLRHQSSATAMPQGGGQMAETDIAALENWIQKGAK